MTGRRTVVRAGLRRLLGERAGGAAVEFALVVPLLMLIVWGLVSFGIYFLLDNEMLDAARSGARYGAVNGGAPQSAVTRTCSSVPASQQTIHDVTCAALASWVESGRSFDITVQEVSPADPNLRPRIRVVVHTTAIQFIGLDLDPAAAATMMDETAPAPNGGAGQQDGDDSGNGNGNGNNNGNSNGNNNGNNNGNGPPPWAGGPPPWAGGDDG
jgi:hypothetical protein